MRHHDPDELPDRDPTAPQEPPPGDEDPDGETCGACGCPIDGDGECPNCEMEQEYQ